MREKILNLLGKGLTPTLVATAVGCEVSYISQLLAEEDFAMQVAQLRCMNLEAATLRDEKWDSLEDQLLAKLEDVMPFMLKPRDILDALTRVNQAKRRGATSIAQPQIAQTTIVNLQLPMVALSRFQALVNNQNEVVQVGDRPLINMPATTLMKSLEDRRAASESSSVPKIAVSSKQAARSVITEDSV